MRFLGFSLLLHLSVFTGVHLWFSTAIFRIINQNYNGADLYNSLSINVVTPRNKGGSRLTQRAETPIFRTSCLFAVDRFLQKKVVPFDLPSHKKSPRIARAFFVVKGDSINSGLHRHHIHRGLRRRLHHIRHGLRRRLRRIHHGLRHHRDGERALRADEQY